MSFNNCTFTGRIGRDAELKTIGSGKQVASFSVAVQDRQGDPVLWLQVKAWEKTAEFCGKHAKKGENVLVSGRLEVREYEKDGQKRTAVELVAQRVEIFWGKQEKPPAPADTPPPPSDDDIPF